MSDIQQRARHLLAEQYDLVGLDWVASKIRDAHHFHESEFSLKAIVAALQHEAPLAKKDDHTALCERTGWLTEQFGAAWNEWNETFKESWEHGDDVPGLAEYCALWVAEREAVVNDNRAVSLQPVSAAEFETDDWKLTCTLDWKAKDHRVTCEPCSGVGQVDGGFKSLDGPRACSKCHGSGFNFVGTKTLQPPVSGTIREMLRRTWWDLLQTTKAP